MYLINVIIFNEVHLRKKNERVGWVLMYVYYLPYKIVLTFVNVASCYWSLYKYARYFAKRHPKVIEDEKAVECVIRLEEEQACGVGRRLTVRTVGQRSRPSGDDGDEVRGSSDVDRMETSGGHSYAIITEPEHVHSPGLYPPQFTGASRPTSETLKNEGVVARDYFAEAAARQKKRLSHLSEKSQQHDMC